MPDNSEEVNAMELSMVADVSENKTDGFTNIFEYIHNSNHELRFNVDHKVVFQPYTKDGKFINGLVVIVVHRNGCQINLPKELPKDFSIPNVYGFENTIYCGGTQFHDPDSNISSVPSRRRIQNNVILNKGDKIIIYFLAQHNEILNTNKSIFRMGKIEDMVTNE